MTERIKEIEIAGRSIGPSAEPFIVAELSANHNGSLERAIQIAEAAARAGAHALKLQTYTADTMTIESDAKDFQIQDPGSLWKGYSLYKLYEKASTPWEWHEPLFARCKQLGLICFSTPFDLSAVDFLETLDVPAYKIGSFENIDTPLLKKVARTGKPIIASTGMATVGEIEELVGTLREAGCRDLVLLKCTSTYPASPTDTHLRTIPHLRTLFQVQVGLSDHTLGIGASVASVALGATVIERHFTLSRKDGGVDAAFSLEPDELAQLVQETQRAWQALGGVHYGPTQKERGSLNFRRSLFVVRDLQAGETLTEENIRIIRPGTGLAPRFLPVFVGKRVNRNVTKGTPLSWDLIG